MGKIVIFAFSNDPMYFFHLLLNLINMSEKSIEVKLILEGASTKFVPELISEKSMFYKLFKKAQGKGLVAGICKACAQKMGTLDLAKQNNFPLLDDMSGHAGMANFIIQGYNIITL